MQISHSGNALHPWIGFSQVTTLHFRALSNKHIYFLKAQYVSQELKLIFFFPLFPFLLRYCDLTTLWISNSFSLQFGRIEQKKQWCKESWFCWKAITMVCGVCTIPVDSFPDDLFKDVTIRGDLHQQQTPDSVPTLLVKSPYEEKVWEMYQQPSSKSVGYIANLPWDGTNIDTPAHDPCGTCKTGRLKQTQAVQSCLGTYDNLLIWIQSNNSRTFTVLQT